MKNQIIVSVIALEAMHEHIKNMRVQSETDKLEIKQLTERNNKLEEWLTEYRDQLKKENAYHKNTGTINAINELLNES
jgi:hypothetical protein